MVKKNKKKAGEKTNRELPKFFQQMTLTGHRFCAWLEDGLQGRYVAMHFGLGSDIRDQFDVQVKEYDWEKECVILLPLTESENALLVNRKSAKDKILAFGNEAYRTGRANYEQNEHTDGYFLPEGFWEFEFTKEEGGKWAGWDVQTL